MERVRAKFSVDSVDKNPEYDYKTLKMSACTNDGGDGKDFTKYTPWGNIEMGIDVDAPASEFFEEGELYYIEFVKIEK